MPRTKSELGGRLARRLIRNARRCACRAHRGHFEFDDAVQAFSQPDDFRWLRSHAPRSIAPELGKFSARFRAKRGRRRPGRKEGISDVRQGQGFAVAQWGCGAQPLRIDTSRERRSRAGSGVHFRPRLSVARGRARGAWAWTGRGRGPLRVPSVCVSASDAGRTCWNGRDRQSAGPEFCAPCVLPGSRIIPSVSGVGARDALG